MNMKKMTLVVYLDGDNYREIRGLQESVSGITGSKRSIDDWLPHITVGDAISVHEYDLVDLEKQLATFCSSKDSFAVSVNSFGGKENWSGAMAEDVTSYVLWAEVADSKELNGLFDELREKITSRYNLWLDRIETYQPHVTIAFADLDQDGYERGKSFLEEQKIDLQIPVSHIALVECFGKGNMQSREYKRFELS